MQQIIQISMEAGKITPSQDSTLSAAAFVFFALSRMYFDPEFRVLAVAWVSRLWIFAIILMAPTVYEYWLLSEPKNAILLT